MNGLYIVALYENPKTVNKKPIEYYLFNKDDLKRASHKFNEVLVSPLGGGKYDLTLGEGILSGSIPEFNTILDSVSFRLRKKRWEK